MLEAIALVVGVVFGFVAGWLVRDAMLRPLRNRGEEFGLGVPGQWSARQRATGERGDDG